MRGSVERQRPRVNGAASDGTPELGMIPAGREWDSSLYRMACEQFRRTADVLELDPEPRARLVEPRRALVVNFPVRMDDGRVESFTGYRVQHTLTMGPTKGGLRYATDVSIGGCAALAMWMTWKCALLGLPYGGAKGGVRCRPECLTERELESITRRYASELIPIVGPDRDIPAPDVSTGEREMAWFYDTYSQSIGHPVPEIVTGKPPVLGGTSARAPATGVGVAWIVHDVVDHLGWGLADLRVVVQGFGNVGAALAARLHSLGTRIVGVSDAVGGVQRPGGLDIGKLREWVERHGSVRGFPGGEPVARDAVLELPCDVLIPAAMTRQITAENAGRLQCRLVVEAANGPTTLEGEDVLAGRGIRIVPDILANAGGVAVSYYEWVHNQQKYFWTPEEIEARLRKQMSVALGRVLGEAERRGVDWRRAALAVAVDRVARAARLRGIYP